MIWCAEIGSSHQGDLSLAYELIRKSAWAGATVAKFQLGWTEEAQLRYAGNYDHRRHIDHWARQLNDWCDHHKIEFMASIWSFEGLEVARKVGMKRYKIAHQMNDGKLIEAMMSDGKEVFSSNPAIEATHTIFAHDLYPMYPDSAYVLAVRGDEDGQRDEIRLPRQGLHLGMNSLSSHMHGIADALIAVAYGANYIEKHITLDKTMPFPRDNSFALLPEEFRTMVDVGNEMVALR